jgi:tetratricopeptide (TPR) repeat protein
MAATLFSRPGRQAICGCFAVALALGAAGCGNFSAQGKNAEGVRLYQQARFQDAMRQFQEARYDDPSNPDAYYNLGATLHRLGHLENRPDDLRQAEHYYRMCLDRNADHRDGYRGLAVLLAEQGRVDEAAALLQGWGERQPTSSDARIEIARLYDEWGYRDRAKLHLQEALALQPENPRALAALGKVREESGERVEALAAYRKSLALDNRQAELASRISSLQTSIAPTAAGSWATGGNPVAPGAAPANAQLRWGAQPGPALR